MIISKKKMESNRGDRIETSPVYELLSGKPKEIHRRGREERKHLGIFDIRQRKKNNGKWSVQNNEGERKLYRSRSRSVDRTNNKSSTKSDAIRSTSSGVLIFSMTSSNLEIQNQEMKNLKRKLNNSQSDSQTELKIAKRQLH